MMLLVLGFGWAKPVMIDPRNFKKPRRDMALTAIAGPAANMLMALAAMILLKIIHALSGNGTAFTDAFLQVLVFVVIISLNLAVFNLLPVPPLDGSKVLGFFLPDKIYALFIRYEKVIMIALLFLIWQNYLNAPIEYLSGKLFNLLDLITPPFNLFV